MGWADVAAALVLGTSCAGCERPGRTWCDQCLQDLQDAVAPELLGTDPALVACCRYEGCVPEAVVGFKDRGMLGLGVTLGHVAAAGVQVLLEAIEQPDVVLVPAPSSAAAIRRRGFDHMWRIAQVAAETCGLPNARVLSSKRRRDQAGLASKQRRRNVTNTMSVRAGVDRPVVVIDDVRTSGATLAECDRALTAAGIQVAGRVVISSAM